VTAFADVALVAFDIDGTLTDATTWWAGEQVGWVQRYSVRDGEAILRMKARIPIVPISRNVTDSARRRIELLGLDARWLGVSDKLDALAQVCREYVVEPARVCFVGDGIDDAGVFGAVGLGCAVADAHPKAIAAARVVLQARGGQRVMEELERRLEAAA
jgi:3-deoxy-D-manno-octulosonate 8-phosphate phosphatase (KDO 8-P phosphatase)